MSVNPASNSPVQLSGDNTLTKEGAQNISKALSPFAQNHEVSKNISGLDTIQPRTVTSVDTSCAKNFFNSLAQAICDVCHNVRAFFSQSDETILGIGRPTTNLVETLREHQDEIKDLFNKAPSSGDAKKLRDAQDMLMETYKDLKAKLNNGNTHDYNLAGDGREVLEEILEDMEQALEILTPNWKEQIRQDIRQAGKGVKNFFENVAKKAGNALDKMEFEAAKLNKRIEKNTDEMIGNAKKEAKRVGKEVNKFFNS